MFYVYALFSLKTKILYIGSTGDLKQRLKDHNKSKGGYFSKRNMPFKLIYYEAHLNKTDALIQEKFYKTGHGREVLKDKVKESLVKICGVV